MQNAINVICTAKWIRMKHIKADKVLIKANIKLPKEKMALIYRETIYGLIYEDNK
jgi:hypothetical protein